MAARWRSTYSRKRRDSDPGIGAASLFLFLSRTTSGEQGRMLFTVSRAWRSSIPRSREFEARRTASARKRDGTLGLLFLTDLKGAMSCSASWSPPPVTAFYGLLAMMPILSLAVMLGGVSGRRQARSRWFCSIPVRFAGGGRVCLHRQPGRAGFVRDSGTDPPDHFWPVSVACTTLTAWEDPGSSVIQPF